MDDRHALLPGFQNHGYISGRLYKAPVRHPDAPEIAMTAYYIDKNAVVVFPDDEEQRILPPCAGTGERFVACFGEDAFCRAVKCSREEESSFYAYLWPSYDKARHMLATPYTLDGMTQYDINLLRNLVWFGRKVDTE